MKDEPKANAAEVGEAGRTMHRVSINSHSGKTVVFVTDGRHLPVPYRPKSPDIKVSHLDSTREGAHRERRPEIPRRYITEVHQNAS